MPLNLGLTEYMFDDILTVIFITVRKKGLNAA